MQSAEVHGNPDYDVQWAVHNRRLTYLQYILHYVQNKDLYKHMHHPHKLDSHSHNLTLIDNRHQNVETSHPDPIQVPLKYTMGHVIIR